MVRGWFRRVMVQAITLIFSALYYNASVFEYDVLRSALKDRFGEAFKEVGFSYERIS